jgi:hypothetical protein
VQVNKTMEYEAWADDASTLFRHTKGVGFWRLGFGSSPAPPQAITRIDISALAGQLGWASLYKIM